MKAIFIIFCLFSYLTFAAPTCELFFKSQSTSKEVQYELTEKALQLETFELSGVQGRIQHQESLIRKLQKQLKAKEGSLLFWFYKMNGQIRLLEKELTKEILSYADYLIQRDALDQKIKVLRDDLKALKLLAQEEASHTAGLEIIQKLLKKAVLKPSLISENIQIENKSNLPTTLDQSLKIEEISVKEGLALYKSKVRITSDDFVTFFMIYDYLKKTEVISGFEVDSRDTFSQFFMDPTFLYKGPITLSNRQALSSQSGQTKPELFNRRAQQIKKLQPSLDAQKIIKLVRAYEIQPTIRRQFDFIIPILTSRLGAEKFQRHSSSSKYASTSSSFDFWIWYWMTLESYPSEYKVNDSTLLQISMLPETERTVYLKALSKLELANPQELVRLQAEIQESLSERLQTPLHATPEQIRDSFSDSNNSSTTRYDDTRDSDTGSSYDSGIGDSGSSDSGGGGGGD